MLRIDRLSAWYGEAQVLREVSLEVGAGEIVTLVGRNGAGKTPREAPPAPVGGQRRPRAPDRSGGGVAVLPQDQTVHRPSPGPARHYLLAEGRIAESLDNPQVPAREHELLEYLGI